MGFIIGYRSPSHTIKEPSVAGVISVLIDYVFIEFILEVHVERGFLLLGVFIGFTLSLLGADLGEKVQLHRQERQ